MLVLAALIAISSVHSVHRDMQEYEEAVAVVEREEALHVQAQRVVNEEDAHTARESTRHTARTVGEYAQNRRSKYERRRRAKTMRSALLWLLLKTCRKLCAERGRKKEQDEMERSERAISESLQAGLLQPWQGSLAGPSKPQTNFTDCWMKRIYSNC